MATAPVTSTPFLPFTRGCFTAISWPGCTVTIVLRLQKSIFSSSRTSNGLSGSLMSSISAFLPSMGGVPVATITASFASFRASNDCIASSRIPTFTPCNDNTLFTSSTLGQDFVKNGGSIATDAFILSLSNVTRIRASFSRLSLRPQTLHGALSLMNFRTALKS